MTRLDPPRLRVQAVRTHWAEPKRIPANREVLAFLESQAAPSNPKTASWDIDSYELHSHPDLTERLLEVTTGLTVHSVGAYGVTCVSHPNGVLFAFVRGGFVVFLRLPHSTADADSQPGVGLDWYQTDAFPTELSKPAGTASLSAIVKESWTYAGSLQ